MFLCGVVFFMAILPGGLIFDTQYKELKGKALFILHVMIECFFTSDAVRNYNLWSCQKVCEALTFLLDNIYIRFWL